MDQILERSTSAELHDPHYQAGSNVGGGQNAVFVFASWQEASAAMNSLVAAGYPADAVYLGQYDQRRLVVQRARTAGGDWPSDGQPAKDWPSIVRAARRRGASGPRIRGEPRLD